MYQPVFAHSYSNIINLITSSVDYEHEFLTEVARVGSLPEGLHHQIGGRICMYTYMYMSRYITTLYQLPLSLPPSLPLPFPLPPSPLSLLDRSLSLINTQPLPVKCWLNGSIMLRKASGTWSSSSSSGGLSMQSSRNNTYSSSHWSAGYSHMIGHMTGHMSYYVHLDSP